MVAETVENASRRYFDKDNPKGIYRGSTTPRGDSASQLVERGASLLAEGDARGAIDVANKALGVDHQNVGAYTLRSAAKRRLGDLHGCVEDATEALRWGPWSEQAFVNRSAALCGLGDIAKAVEDCNAALRLNRGCGQAYVNRAVCRGATKDWQGAVDDCLKAMEIDPTDPNAIANLRIAERKLAAQQKEDGDDWIASRGRRTGSESPLSPPVRGHPSAVAAVNEVVEEYHAPAGKMSAPQSYVSGLPSHLTTPRRPAGPPIDERAVRALNRLERRDFPAAVRLYSSALKDNPTNVDYHVQRGLALLGMGQVEHAHMDFHLAISMDPHNAFAISGLQAADQAKRDLESAGVGWFEAETGPPPKPNYWKDFPGKVPLSKKKNTWRSFSPASRRGQAKDGSPSSRKGIAGDASNSHDNEAQLKRQGKVASLAKAKEAEEAKKRVERRREMQGKKQLSTAIKRFAAILQARYPTPQAAFAALDADKSGSLTKSEFVQASRAWGINAILAGAIFSELDADGGGSITAAEFIDLKNVVKAAEADVVVAQSDPNYTKGDKTANARQFALEKLWKLLDEANMNFLEYSDWSQIAKAMRTVGRKGYQAAPLLLRQGLSLVYNAAQAGCDRAKRDKVIQYFVRAFPNAPPYSDEVQSISGWGEGDRFVSMVKLFEESAKKRKSMAGKQPVYPDPALVDPNSKFRAAMIYHLHNFVDGHDLDFVVSVLEPGCQSRSMFLKAVRSFLRLPSNTDQEISLFFDAFDVHGTGSIDVDDLLSFLDVESRLNKCPLVPLWPYRDAAKKGTDPASLSPSPTLLKPRPTKLAYGVPLRDQKKSPRFTRCDCLATTSKKPGLPERPRSTTPPPALKTREMSHPKPWMLWSSEHPIEKSPSRRRIRKEKEKAGEDPGKLSATAREITGKMLAKFGDMDKARRHMDASGDGAIGLSEFTQACKGMGIDYKDAKAVFQELDDDKSLNITIKELLRMEKDYQDDKQELELHAANKRRGELGLVEQKPKGVRSVSPFARTLGDAAVPTVSPTKYKGTVDVSASQQQSLSEKETKLSEAKRSAKKVTKQPSFSELEEEAKAIAATKLQAIARGREARRLVQEFKDGAHGGDRKPDIGKLANKSAVKPKPVKEGDKSSKAKADASDKNSKTNLDAGDTSSKTKADASDKNSKTNLDAGANLLGEKGSKAKPDTSQKSSKTKPDTGKTPDKTKPEKSEKISETKSEETDKTSKTKPKETDTAGKTKQEEAAKTSKIKPEGSHASENLTPHVDKTDKTKPEESHKPDAGSTPTTGVGKVSIEVHIMEAAELSTIGPRREEPSACCEIYWEGKLIHTTQVQPLSVEPVWDEERVHIQVPEGGSEGTLDIQVFHIGIKENIFLGMVSFAAADLLESEEGAMQYELEAKDGLSKEDEQLVKGSIVLQVTRTKG